MKKTFIFLFSLALFIIVGGAYMAKAQSTPVNLVRGWLWSSNIGWISLNSNDAGATGGPYSVTIATSTATTGTFDGYAWSKSLGWISFKASDVENCPIGPCPATINLETGKIDGWVRALTIKDRTDMSNGWIHLSGTNHVSPNLGGATFASTTGLFSDYAWGGGISGTGGSLTFTPPAAPSFDGNTNSYRQWITVTNGTSQTLTGVRLTLQTSLSQANAWNPQGTDAQGKTYWQSNYPLAPGASVRIQAVYTTNSPSSIASLVYIVSALNTALTAPPTPAESTEIAITKGAFTSGLGQYVNTNSATSIGENYMIQYSDNGGANWKNAYGNNSTEKIFTGSGSIARFYDTGSPNTVSIPTATRLYKVLKLPTSWASYTRESTTFDPSSSADFAGIPGWVQFNASCPTCTIPGTTVAGPDKPVITSVIAYSCGGQIKISWTSIPGYSYKVYRDNGSNLIGNSNTNEYIDQNAGIGTPRTYYIIATNNGVDSAQSDPVGANGSAACVPPSKPNVSVDTYFDQCGGNVIISWNNVQNATSYQIFKSDSPSSGFVSIKTITAGTSETHIDNAGPNSTKYYYVIAYNNDVPSLQSDTEDGLGSPACVVTPGTLSFLISSESVTKDPKLTRVSIKKGEKFKLWWKNNLDSTVYTGAGACIGVDANSEALFDPIWNNKPILSDNITTNILSLSTTNIATTQYVYKIKCTGITGTQDDIEKTVTLDIVSSNEKED